MARIEETPEGAQRVARIIASDISLYNEKKIIQGIVDDNLFDVMAPEFEEGLTHFRGRVTPQIFDTTNYYWRAIIDVLLKSKGHVKSKIW